MRRARGEITGTLTPKITAAVPGGLTLAVVAIQVDQDLVSLRRRTRAAGGEFGLAPRAIRSLSAAVYEASRLLLAHGGAVAAELRLTDAPALQVALRTPTEGVRPALDGALAALGPLVDDLHVDDSRGFSVLLSMNLPPVGARAAGPADDAAPMPGDAGAEPSSDVAAENAALRRQIHELQAELQETNRGVVALYAELDDQAQRLRQAEDRLRVLLDSVQDYAICMLDRDGEIVSWNSGAERLFGYSADEITGRQFSCFYTVAEREEEAAAAHLSAALENGRFECEGLRVRRGGSAFDAHVLIMPMRGPEGTLRGYSLVVRDVTERRRLEDDLRRRAEDLAAANRAKEDFLATLSHELRTPLNAMLGWTRLLRMGKLDEAAMGRALETIERNAHVQEQLIADILDVSRIVTGKLRLSLRPIGLAPVVDAALDAVRPAAEAKGVHLECSVRFKGSVLGDPDRLQQVVWNLLANAIKFTPAGGRISVSVTHSSPYALITITDTGEGIAPDLLPYIFDRFTQGDGSVTRPHGGLGLGLSIVRHIVELHGGHVKAHSEGTGGGARFTVHLPIRSMRAPADNPAV